MAVERTQGSGSYGTSRTVLVGSLIGLVLAAIGITVLIDKEGGQKLLASIYDLLGNAAGAEALRNGQGDQFFAKLLLGGHRAAGRRGRDLAPVHGRERAGRAPATGAS